MKKLDKLTDRQTDCFNVSEDEKQPLRDFFIRESRRILKDLNLKKMGAF